MNDNRLPVECQQVQTTVQQRTRSDGKILFSTPKTGNGKCSAKRPLEPRKPKLSKGSTGLSRKQKEEIDLAFHAIHTTYGLQNCKWMVFTFDHDSKTSGEALINLLDNFSKLNKAIKHKFEHIAYKNLEIEPYVLVWGIRELTSFSRKIPCFDLNILCAVKDKDGNQLFDEDEIIYQIYLTASKLAGETIKRPLDFYSREPDDNYIRLGNYFKIQVSPDVLKHFQNSDYADKLPNTYSYVPKSLSNTFVDIITKFENSNINEHKQLLREEFSEIVTFEDGKNDDYNFVAKLKQDVSTTEFSANYQQAHAQTLLERYNKYRL